MPKPGTVTGKQILKLIEKQQYRCALSGRKLTPETASLDHVVPLSRGGKHDISNLQVLEHHVNTAKGTLTVDEFISLCEDVARHTRGILMADEEAVVMPHGS